MIFISFILKKKTKKNSTFCYVIPTVKPRGRAGVQLKPNLGDVAEKGERKEKTREGGKERGKTKGKEETEFKEIDKLNG